MIRASTTVKNLVRWLSALLQWLREPRLAWLTALAIAAAIILAIWIRSEPAFRLTGLALQILGTATVALNIHNTRTQFDRPGTFELAAQWWQRRPRFRASVNIATGVAEIGAAMSTERAYVWSNMDSDAPLEVRLDKVEKNLTRLKDRLEEFQQETEKDMRQHADSVDQERITRESDDKIIREELKDSQTGGLNISTAGVTLLVIGVIMSTASIEANHLAKFLFG